MANTSDGRSIIILAFNTAMFEQAMACLATVRKHCSLQADLGVVAIGLSNENQASLRALGATVVTDLGSLPFYADAPPYAYAMTCRPYLRELFPGYDVYLYVDADIRFQHPDAFALYLGQAAAEPRAIVICQEVDPAYSFVQNPEQAYAYHNNKYNRMLRAYGPQAAEYMRYFNCYNAGLFAMHRDAPTWASYRNALEIAMRGPFDHMAEQDAMAVAIVQDKLQVRVTPTTMNWLCSIAAPAFHEESKQWVRPIYPHLPIAVLHLTNSNDKVPGSEPERTFYQLYQQRQMTA